MLDPVLAQYLWHERDRKLALEAELARQLHDGCQLAPTLTERLRVWSGDALIAFGYRLKRSGAVDDSRALGVPSPWTPTISPGDASAIRPYTLIYSQLLPMGSGRGAGVMLLSMTWLPAWQISAQP